MRSWRKASSTAAASPSGAVTLLMPTLEPRLAGFTKQGYPKALTASASAAPNRRFRSTTWSATAMPTPRSTYLTLSLSMVSAEAATPDPT